MKSKIKIDTVVTACTSCRGQSLLGYATVTGKSFMFEGSYYPHLQGQALF
jgi:hypothetical protein